MLISICSLVDFESQFLDAGGHLGTAAYKGDGECREFAPDLVVATEFLEQFEMLAQGETVPVHVVSVEYCFRKDIFGGLP